MPPPPALRPRAARRGARQAARAHPAKAPKPKGSAALLRRRRLLDAKVGPTRPLEPEGRTRLGAL